jgi:hypothetical protein
MTCEEKKQHGDIFFISVLKQRIKFCILNEEIKTKDLGGVKEKKI